ncbi:hypothetical protein [Cyclobacterium marinum]|uniref:hypothetical protein n=1 Tax=Cyclobacterium marinum TaxID=104 RepID=UPI0030D72117|tara:strand:- start:23990 stop:26020 length:2031 start_codon:yes stop_codon:yes gene_type:complete
MTNWRFIFNSEERGEYETAHEPMSWRDRETRLVRNMNTYGITREITSPIVFIKDAKAYVQDVFNQSGYNANITFRVFEYNPLIRDYEQYFSGVLILKGIEIGPSELQVMATPNTIQERIKNRGNTEIELSSTFSIGGNAVFVENEITALLHSRLIVQSQSNLWASEKTIPMTSGQLLQIGWDEYPKDDLKGWIKERVTIASSEVFPVYKCEEGGNHVFDVFFAVDSSSGYEDELQFYYRLNNNSPVPVSTSYVSVVDGFSYSFYLVEFDGTIAMEPGDTFYFYGVCGRSFTAKVGVRGFTRYPALDEDRFTVNARTYNEPNEAGGFLAFEAFNQVLKSVTDRKTILSSSVLGRTDLGYNVDGAAALNMITSGAKIANKTGNVKTTLNKLLKAFKCAYNLGMSVVSLPDGTEKVVVEEMPYFFKNKVGVTLTDVWNLRKRVAVDLVHNRVNAGYAKYETDINNSQDDYCTQSTYIIPGLFIENELDLLNPFIASMYAIEQKRRLAGSDDEKFDNDVFIISLVRDIEGYKSRTNEGFESVLGIEDPASAYNLDLHLSRCLERHGNYIASNYYKKNGLLGYSASESASNLQTLKSGENRYKEERKAIQSKALTNPLWFPEVYEFEAKLTTSQDREVQAKMFEIIEVVTPYETVYGYLMERTRSEGNEATFTLLRANYNG